MSLLKKSLLSVILAGAVIGTSVQAQAAFVYDLRFVTNQPGVSADQKTVDLTTAGSQAIGYSYQVQLWGQVIGTGTPNLANDKFSGGYVSLTDNSTGGSSANAAVLTGGASNFSLAANGSKSTGQTAASLALTDGLTGWGSTATGANSASKWIQWNAATGGVPMAGGGTTTTEYEAVGTTGWEILLGTFTIKVNSAAAQGATAKTTTFNTMVPVGTTSSSSAQMNGTASFVTSGPATKVTGVDYYQDNAGASTEYKYNTSPAGTFSTAATNGVTFQVDKQASGAVAALFNGGYTGVTNYSGGGNATLTIGFVSENEPAGGYYNSPVLELTGASKGSVPLAGSTIAAANEKYVMLWVDSADETAIYAALNGLNKDGTVNGLVAVEDINNKGSDWNSLAGYVDNNAQANTDSSGKGFNILLKFKGGTAATGDFSWDFTSTNSASAKLLAVAIVPEPASLGLLALGALGLLSRKRK